MSETHPNALRMEAQEARAEGNRLLAHADELERRANLVDPQEEVETETAKPKQRRKSNGHFAKK